MAQSATFQEGVSGAGTFKDGSLWSAGARSGTATTAPVGVASDRGSTVAKRVIIQMGLDEIPDKATVTSGILTLNVTGAASGTANTLVATLSTETDWTESGSYPSWAAKDGSNNWSTAGRSIDSPSVECGLLPTSTGAHTIDITRLVRDAVEKRSKVLNIVLKDKLEGTGGAFDTFTMSTGDSTTTGNRPKLSVKYVEGGGAAGKMRAATMRSGSRRSAAKKNRRLFRR